MASSAVRTNLNLCYKFGRKGVLNLPGTTSASKKAAEDLLLKDAESHHCFFRASGFHNHLSHHLLAAYDLGAPTGLLRKIYEDEASSQRPILLEEQHKVYFITEGNWKQYLANQGAYKAYVEFFAGEIREFGAANTLRKFIFKEGKDVHMLIRLVSGALHPFIQVGYGAEFGINTLVATGLAQAAMHSPNSPETLLPILEHDHTTAPADEEKTTSLLHLLRKVYDCDALHPPMPYDPDMLFTKRLQGALANGGAEALQKLCLSYPIHPTSGTIASHIEQCIWVSTLLTFATSKANRKPRLDFFLMHLLNSSLFLRSITNNLLGGPQGTEEELDMQVQLLKVYIPIMLIITLARGRPRIDVTTLMAHTATPRPPTPTPSAQYTVTETSLKGDPTIAADYNPWPLIWNGVVYHSDSHVVKAMRSLIYAAREYGDVPAGGAIGTFAYVPDGVHATLPTSGAEGVQVEAKERISSKESVETHKGTADMDGTIFVRAAGMLMDSLGWVTHGQKEQEWDRSALGWEAAWDKEPSIN